MRLIICVGQCHLKCPQQWQQKLINFSILRFFDFSIFRFLSYGSRRLNWTRGRREDWEAVGMFCSLRQSSGLGSLAFWPWQPVGKGPMQQAVIWAACCLFACSPSTQLVPHLLLPCRLQLWVASGLCFYYAKLSEPLQASRADSSNDNRQL